MDQTITSPTVTRIIQPPHSRTSSRSSFRQRLPSDDIIYDLTPEKIIDALSNPSSHLNSSLAVITPNERAFTLRVALAYKKINEWYDELSSWPWPKAGSLTGLSRSPEGEGGFIFFPNITLEKADIMVPDHRINSLESLNESQIRTYEIRLDEVHDSTRDLRVDEIKRQVLDSQFFAKNRPSSSCSTPPTPDFPTSTAYVKLDDFTAIVTTITLQALPQLKKLSVLLEVWFKRICFLRRIPILLTDLEDAEIAMKSGWNAICTPDMDKEIKGSQKSITLTRKEFDVIRNVLEQKITTIGQSIDIMLDILAGSQNTLPETWLDRMEALVRDFGEWVVAADGKVINGELLKLENEKNTSVKTYELVIKGNSSKWESKNEIGLGRSLYPTKKLASTDLTIVGPTEKNTQSLNQEKPSCLKPFTNSFPTKEIFFSTINDAMSSQGKMTAEITTMKINQIDDNLRPRQFLESEVSLPILDATESQSMELNNKTSFVSAKYQDETRGDFSLREQNSKCDSMLDNISASDELNFDDPLSKNFPNLFSDAASLVSTKNGYTGNDFNDFPTSKHHVFNSLHTHYETPDVALESNYEISTAPSISSSDAKREILDSTDSILDGNDVLFSGISEPYDRMPNEYSSDLQGPQIMRCNVHNTENENLKHIFLNSSANEIMYLGVSHTDSDKFSQVDNMDTNWLIDADSATRNETESEASSMLFTDQPTFNDTHEIIPNSLDLSPEMLQNSACGMIHESNNTPTATNLSNNSNYLSPNPVIFSTDGCVESCLVEKPGKQKDNSKPYDETRSEGKLPSKTIPMYYQISENAEPSISINSKTENSTNGDYFDPNSKVMGCKSIDISTPVSTLSTPVRASLHKKTSAEGSFRFHINSSPFIANNSFSLSPISPSNEITFPYDIVSSEHKSSSILESSRSNLSITYQRHDLSPSPTCPLNKSDIIIDSEGGLSELPPETRVLDIELIESPKPATPSSLTNNYVNKGKMSPVLEEALNVLPNISTVENYFLDEDTDSDQKDEPLDISPSLRRKSSSKEKSLGSGPFENSLHSNNINPSKFNTSLTKSFQIEDQSPSIGLINYSGNIYFNISPPDSPLVTPSKSRSFSCGPHLSDSHESSEDPRYKNSDSYQSRKTIAFDANEATKNDQFERQISSLIKSMPLICLSSESDSATYNPEGLQPREARPKIRSLKRQTSNLSVRSSNSVTSSTLTLSPVFGKTHSRTRYQNGNSEIRVYQLSRSTGEAPIKLFVRLVGEHGERVMVRVGGGWADLGEYLREYVSHHGRRSAIDNIKVHKVSSRNFSGNASRVSSITRENGRSSPFQRPQSVVEQRPRNNLSVPKTRKLVAGNNSVEHSNLRPRKNSFQYPSTPLPVIPNTICKTPPSVASSNGTAASAASDRSSRMSWIEEEFNLGLAGPRSKKSTMSDRDLEWVESMKEKVRLASAEKDRRHRENAERSENSRERGYSLGELERSNGSKRLFRRDGSVDL